jgi:peptidoglycan/LPS O-acetylase OafA/YrhL
MLSDERGAARSSMDASGATAPGGDEPQPPVPDTFDAPDQPDPAVDTAVRTAELDGLRAVAVLLVFGYHVGLKATPLHRYVAPEFFYMQAGVEVFFVLSGFLIYTPFVRAHLAGDGAPRPLDYLRRRALRIYPAYWVAFGLLLAVGWIAVEGVGRTLQNLTLTQGYREVDVLTGQGIEPAWTLCVEVTFYAFVPLWAALVRRAARPGRALRTELAGAVLLMATGVGAIMWDELGSIPVALRVLFPHLVTLGGGMVLAIVATARTSVPRVDRVARWVPPALVCWPLAFVAALRMPGQATSFQAPDGDWVVFSLTQSLFGLLLAAPIMLGAGGVLSRALRWRPVAWVGLVSYGIYLWHYDVVFDLWPGAWETGRVRAVLASFGFLAVSVALGAASYYLVERPAQAWARRLERRRRAAGATPRLPVRP